MDFVEERDARPDALWYPTLTASATMAERLAHIELIAEEIPLRMCAFDPGSTNIGQPGPDGLPVGGVYGVSYDDCRYAFEFCDRLKMGPALGIYEPNSVRTTLAYRRAGKLPAGYPVDEHFNPDYDPWDQRLCAVPDGDLFDAISAGSARVESMCRQASSSMSAPIATRRRVGLPEAVGWGSRPMRW